MSEAARRRIEDERDQALADLADIDRQLAAGEIDAATHEQLAAVYRDEAEAAETRLTELAEREPPPARSWKRAAVGTGLFLAAAAVATVAAINAVEDRPEGGFATGGVVSDLVADAPVDLADVTIAEMEAVVADNPDVTGMRLALARRYVEEGNPSAAIPHYTYILDRERNAEALAYLGWIAWLGGEAEVASGYLTRALEVEADRPEALWFLSIVRTEGLDDPAGAVPLLEQLLEDPELVGEFRDTVEAQLEAAKAAAS